MNIAIIPARGGSKRIPRKNIKQFHGKPMICWSIDTAKASGLFEHIIVSTDDLEIADIAKNVGAEVPFTRPAELANDSTPTVPVVAHAIDACAGLGWVADHVCCIYPCAPFARVDDIKAGLSMLKEKDADYVYPVVEYTHPVQRAMLRSVEGGMKFLFPEHELARTQDLQKTFHDAGQFYWGKSNSWQDMKKMHSGGLGLIIPSWSTVDIDTEDDWDRAELIFHTMRDR